MSLQMHLDDLVVLDTATSAPVVEPTTEPTVRQTVKRTPAELREKNEAFNRTMAIHEMGTRWSLKLALQYLPLSLEELTELWHQAQADKAADLARYGESVRFRYERFGGEA
jgi:hypothetical protein